MRLTLFLNHRCNLRCSYCYNGEQFNRAMPIEVARRAIDFGLDRARHGWLQLSFFGGEPLLERDLLEAAAAYAVAESHRRGKRLLLSIATNGTVLDDRLVALLRRHQFHVQVSFDGTPAAHDAARRHPDGRSSHAQVEANVRRLLAEGFDLRVISVVDPANVDQLGASFEYLADLGLPRLYFAPNYLGAWDETACGRFEVALRDLGDRYAARLRAGRDVRLDPLSGKIVTRVVEGSNDRVRCDFGRDELAVSPTGRFYPCDRLVRADDGAGLCLGDLDRGLDEAKRDRILAEKQVVDDECASCPLRRRCMHWCGCANYETTGNPAHVSPLICWFERCVIAEADRIAEALFAEQNPTFMRRFYLSERKPRGT